ncbi:MAG: hypothetical protein KDA69_09340 [Planctomycetaceae bacterium]|nr:hypothetical protein [Planctomycetaceae bacterium]
MLFRLQILLIIGGIALGIYSFQEMRAGTGASADPVAVELADLEAGTPAPDKHLQVGDHIALYHGTFYQWEQQNNEPENGGSRVTKAYYPIISPTHPYAEGMDADADLESFAVLVKTNRFSTIGEIPDMPGPVQSISGLTRPASVALESDFQDLLRSDYPGINLDQILVLEDGRQPTSVALGIIMMLASAALIAAGGAWMFASARS